MSPTPSHGAFNATRRPVEILVFPNTDTEPSGRGEEPVRLKVAFHISIELLLPEERIRLWVGSMFGAAMPETAINEDSHASRPKHYVRGSAGGLHWPGRDAIAEPARMQEAP